MDQVILWKTEHRVSVMTAVLVMDGVEKQILTVPVAVASITVSILKYDISLCGAKFVSFYQTLRLGLGLGLGFDKSRFSAFKHISYYLFLLVFLCVLYALLPVAMQ